MLPFLLWDVIYTVKNVLFGDNVEWKSVSYDGGSITFYKGDCIFVPADSEILTLHGQAQFLDVRG